MDEKIFDIIKKEEADLFFFLYKYERKSDVFYLSTKKITARQIAKSTTPIMIARGENL